MTPRPSAASAVNMQVPERDVTIARRNEIARNTRPERERRSALVGITQHESFVDRQQRTVLLLPSVQELALTLH